ncbi:MAG TPA: hypothetical protein VF478_05115 [Anaerolineae bacterium]
MNELIGELGFVSIFHILGGIALGYAVRGLRNGFDGRKIFFLVWGAGFGCIPLAVGAGIFSDAHAIYLFGIEILVLASAIVVTALIPDEILDTFRSPELVPIEMGGLFILIGIVVGGAMLKTDPLFTILFGGSFAGAGALLFIRGLRALL